MNSPKPFPRLFLIIILGALLAAFWYKAAIFLDPDFGWEMRMGQYILAHGIPYTDPLSYTMPSYPIIAHYWLSSILITKLYPVIGYTGLAGIVALISLVALLILIPAKKITLGIVPLLLASAGLFSYLGVRPHVITWFFMAIFFRGVTDPQLWKKYRHYFPFLMILWVNLHGGFAAGLLILVVKIITDIYQSRKINWPDLCIVALCFLTTIINPYGIYIWREILITLFDPGTRLGINEWQPFLVRLSIIHAPVLAVPLVIFAKYFRKFSLLEKVLFVALLLNGLSSSKMYPLWLLYSIYFSTKGFLFLFEEVKRRPGAVQRMNLIMAGLLAIALSYSAIYGFRVVRIYQEISEEKFYPQKAVEFLQQHPAPGHLFSSFSWGGYLLWQLPNQKTFADGRMPHWENRYAPPQESTKASEEQHKILKSEVNFLTVAKKYRITTVLLPQSYKKQFKKLFSSLKKHGWQKVYEDDIAIIYATISL